MANSEGEGEIVEIAQAVRDGAMAYLTRQYKVVALVFVALVAVLFVCPPKGRRRGRLQSAFLWPDFFPDCAAGSA